MINLFLHLLTEFGLIYGSGIGLGEKKSDPDKRTRIQSKETGSETLVKIISTWFNGCILTCGRASPPETPAVCPSQSD